MGDVVNLNQWRKRKERKAAEEEAAANRAKYGQTKLERLKSTAERERGDKEHEGRLLLDHKPDPKETPGAS
jgi:hypothetical protein